MPSLNDINMIRMLLADWFSKLGREAGLPLDNNRGSSQNVFTLGSKQHFHVEAKFIQDPPFLRFEASDNSKQTLVDSLVKQAVTHVQARELGKVVWYSSTITTVESKFNLPNLMGPFFQQLGTQTRISGWRRLGPDIILEFKEISSPDEKEKPQFFAPQAVVDIHIGVLAPCAGYFSSAFAQSIVELVGTICTFALGRGTIIPPVVFSSKKEEIPILEKRSKDPNILTLARKGIPLDINKYVNPNTFELFNRLRSALFTFDAAIKQEDDTVACILYVVATESLTIPSPSWKHSKLTKRFVTFYDELMPKALDNILTQDNIETVFKIKRGNREAGALRRDLLNKVYGFRSGRVHEGLQPRYFIDATGIDIDSMNRRGVFTEFAEYAILEFLNSPRSTLIGNPEISYT